MANTAKQHLQFKKYEQKQRFDRSAEVIFHQRGGHCQSIAWKTDLKCTSWGYRDRMGKTIEV